LRQIRLSHCGIAVSQTFAIADIRYSPSTMAKVWLTAIPQ